jgi:hypothetical protein
MFFSDHQIELAGVFRRRVRLIEYTLFPLLSRITALWKHIDVNRASRFRLVENYCTSPLF